MEIGTNSTATLVYTLTLADNGKTIEKVTEDKPAVFQFGVSGLLPVFEKNLMGLKNGDGFDFVIKADDAYGMPDPYAIFDIPKDTFEVDGKTDEKMLQVGNVIPMTDNEGNKHHGRITMVGADTVTMDFTHPLAGKDLRFTGKIIEVLNQEKNEL
jgi:FKBP-type peptidyl-prolyl cis-trans isomerase SlyD